MDGLLKPEFALVLKDSLNVTPRRHVVSPPSSKSIQSSQNKSSSSEFRMPCDMQLEPRLHFAPLPTSPTSPLPATAFLDSPIPKPISSRPDHSILSPTKLAIISNDLSLSQKSLSLPISKNRKSSPITKRLSSHLSSTLDSTSSSLPLDVLASVSIEQREKPCFEPVTPINTSIQNQPSISNTTSLPTSPIFLEPSTRRLSDDKQISSRCLKSNKNNGKSNSSGKTFPCSQCKSSFSQQFNLNKHIRAVHERRRPFQCDICHARFQQKSHRNMHHLAVHEKLRQFACDQCNASFSWRGVLKKHRKSIHGIDD